MSMTLHDCKHFQCLWEAHECLLDKEALAELYLQRSEKSQGQRGRWQRARRDMTHWNTEVREEVESSRTVLEINLEIYSPDAYDEGVSALETEWLESRPNCSWDSAEDWLACAWRGQCSGHFSGLWKCRMLPTAHSTGSSTAWGICVQCGFISTANVSAVWRTTKFQMGQTGFSGSSIS